VPSPRTVTLAEPVVGPLTATALLSAGAQKVSDFVKLPAKDDTVIDRSATMGWPCVILQRTELPDSHRLAAVPLPPTRAAALDCAKPAPSTVTLKLPVPALFTGAAPTTATESA
jgi:hypothetical protein